MLILDKKLNHGAQQAQKGCDIYLAQEAFLAGERLVLLCSVLHAVCAVHSVQQQDETILFWRMLRTAAQEYSSSQQLDGALLFTAWELRNGSS